MTVLSRPTVARTVAAAPPPAPRRMTLASITRGKLAKPRRIVVHGPPKVGKSTFAAGAPSPIFIGPEAGSELLDVARFPDAKTWEDLLDACDELAQPGHEFKTAVIDTADWAEPLAWASVCAKSKVPSIEKAGGGYGKGYSESADLFRGLLVRLDALREQGMTIVILAHTLVKEFKNPAGPDYHRYEMKVHKHVSGLLGEWADVIGFAQHEDLASKDDSGRTRAGWSGMTWLHMTRSAAYDAGSRNALPDRVPLIWDEFADALASSSPSSPDALRSEAREIAAQLGEGKRAKIDAAIVAAGDDGAELAKIVSRARATAALGDAS